MQVTAVGWSRAIDRELTKRGWWVQGPPGCGQAGVVSGALVTLKVQPTGLQSLVQSGKSWAKPGLLSWRR